MGTIVPLPPRPGERTATVAHILAKIEELHRRRERAMAALPGLLASLLDAGEAPTVLEAVRLWGSGEREPEEILDLCQRTAGVRHPARR